MRGVTFDNKHSYHQWGLMLSNRPVISPPTPKTKYVDVPGSDGSLDLTNALTGYTQYKNRKINLEFIIMSGRSVWPDMYSDIMDTLHGNVVEIVFDDDPQYVYKGRVTVGDWDAAKKTAVLSMTADVEPYKMERIARKQNLTVAGSGTITVHGTRKPVVPVITVSADMQVSFRGNDYTLTAGENRITDIVLRQGENTLTFTGSGTVSVEYKGGRF